MDVHENAQNMQPPLADQILQSGKRAFDPELPKDERADHIATFDAIIDSSDTSALMRVLNLLIQPGRVQPWLRKPIIAALARLPLRPSGVEHTIEFILAVHPSTSSEASATPGRGANISIEALNAAARLLSSPPEGISPEAWFSGIAPQLLSLLEGEGQPEMDRAAAFVIGFGILGRRQYGTPGMPGWVALVTPILESIDPSASPKQRDIPMVDGIQDLSTANILVSSTDLAKGIKRLSALVTTHPHPVLTKRLLSPILLPLWCLSYFPGGNAQTETDYRLPARKLLKSLLQISSPTKIRTAEAHRTSSLFTIVQNIMFKGRSREGKPGWTYRDDRKGGIHIIHSGGHGAANNVQHLEAIDAAVESFISLLKNTPDLQAEVSSLFMDLCSKWLARNTKEAKPSIVFRETKDELADVEERLTEAKIMQGMMTSFPEKLVDDSRKVLELVSQVLSNFLASSRGRNDEDAVAVALSLLNIVLTAPNFRANSKTDSVLESITVSLQSVDRDAQLDVSQTAQNLLMLLKIRHNFDEPETIGMSTPTDRQVEDRKTYGLAMSYLTTVDSPPPVRVQGLELIAGLVREHSPVLNIPALIVLYSSLLQDADEYIYLRAIQAFKQLSQKHPKSVMKDLIDRYVDSDEEFELDQRLRYGEALLQVIQNSYRAFDGDTSQSVCEGLIFIAGRRGYRPKTEKVQDKRNRLREKKNQEAEEAWDGDVPQLDEYLETESPEQLAILSQIISGWESKRGTEDIRIRASALSILGSGVEANLEGIGTEILSAAVDLSIHILTLEPEIEKAILRRSGILFVMSFTTALDTARASGKKPGFGFVGQSLQDIQRILEYVAETDNDNLVRQHAKDVVENLHAWQLNSLLPVQRDNTELQELAGLSIVPGGVQDSSGRVRPRIEEIE